ncbi:MAG: thiamine pyrophosphate-requiring protein [Actinobacteria bacterium]|nr:thiamine pyrophosphate-requiring protein [Actinomycetota bacterium]
MRPTARDRAAAPVRRAVKRWCGSCWDAPACQRAHRPQPIPAGTDFSLVVESDVPIVVRHTRLPSRDRLMRTCVWEQPPHTQQSDHRKDDEMVTTAEAAMTRLKQWGVTQIFGYPGDGINGLLEAFESVEGTRFIQVRHEELAAFAACAYGKFTDRPGVCMATSGPGAIHLLNGLYDAKLDHSPVVAIVGDQATSSRGTSFQQEVDLRNLFKDVASDYVVEVTSPKQIPVVIDRAYRTAVAGRTVTCIIMASDVQEEEHQNPSNTFKELPGSLAGVKQPIVYPPEDELDRAADVINAGSKVAILVGQGAAGAKDEVKELTELTGAGISKALVGKDVLPDDLPYMCGAIGLLGTRPSWVLMEQCDTLVMIGTTFPYTQFLPEYGQARGVQIDISARNIGLRYPTEVNLLGDAKLTLQHLLPKVHYKQDRSWRQQIEHEVSDWWNLMETRARMDADPVNPQRIFWELSPKLPERCILTADSGSSTNWWARYLKVREGMRASLSGNLATMGPALPYAFAAKMAHPDRPVIATVGDGTMQMNGMNVLIDVAKYWQEWENPTFIVVILNNSDLNQVTWEQRAMGGFAKVAATQDIPTLDFAGYAQLLGLDGVRIEKPEDIVPALDVALRADRPMVIDALTDPEVPPIPPHVSPDQVKNLMSALREGDPNARHLIGMGAKQKLAEFLPRH